MRNQRQLVLAIVIIAVGVLLLAANLLDVNIWMLCWPTALILLGLLLLLRPQLIGSDSSSSVGLKLLGDIRRKGTWDVVDEEFWLGIGDVKLDLTEAEIPVGETQLRIWSLIAGVEMVVPEGVGVAVSSTAFVTDARLFGRKRESILVPLKMVSDDYGLAERQVRIENTTFVGDIKVKRS